MPQLDIVILFEELSLAVLLLLVIFSIVLNGVVYAAGYNYLQYNVSKKFLRYTGEMSIVCAFLFSGCYGLLVYTLIEFDWNHV